MNIRDEVLAAFPHESPEYAEHLSRTVRAVVGEWLREAAAEDHGVNVRDLNADEYCDDTLRELANEIDPR